MLHCDKRKCYLQVLHQGTLSPAVFSDPAQTQPYVFSCDHVAGQVALEILGMSYAAWLGGQLDQPCFPWHFKVVYLTEEAYPEIEPASLEDANRLINSLLKGLL